MDGIGAQSMDEVAEDGEAGTENLVVTVKQ